MNKIGGDLAVAAAALAGKAASPVDIVVKREATSAAAAGLRAAVQKAVK